MDTPGIAPKTCWICGNILKLEECNVDEHGLAVHEACYLMKVGLDQHRTAHNPESDITQSVERPSIN